MRLTFVLLLVGFMVAASFIPAFSKQPVSPVELELREALERQHQTKKQEFMKYFDSGMLHYYGGDMIGAERDFRLALTCFDIPSVRHYLTLTMIKQHDRGMIKTLDPAWEQVKTIRGQIAADRFESLSIEDKYILELRCAYLAFMIRLKQGNAKVAAEELAESLKALDSKYPDLASNGRLPKVAEELRQLLQN